MVVLIAIWVTGIGVHMIRPHFPWSTTWEQHDERQFAEDDELRRQWSMLPPELLPLANGLYRLTAAVFWPIKRVQWAIHKVGG